VPDLLDTRSGKPCAACGTVKRYHFNKVAADLGYDVMATGHSTVANGLNEGFQSAFLAGAVIAALGFVATLVLIRTRDSKAHVEMSNAEPAQAEVPAAA